MTEHPGAEDPPPEPPPGVEVEEPLRKREVLGCLGEGCCTAGCLFDLLVWSVLLAVVASYGRFRSRGRCRTGALSGVPGRVRR